MLTMQRLVLISRSPKEFQGHCVPSRMWVTVVFSKDLIALDSDCQEVLSTNAGTHVAQGLSHFGPFIVAQLKIL